MRENGPCFFHRERPWWGVKRDKVVYVYRGAVKGVIVRPRGDGNFGFGVDPGGFVPSKSTPMPWSFLFWGWFSANI